MPFKRMSIKDIEKWVDIKQEDIPKYLIVDCAWPWKRGIKDAKKYLRDPEPHLKWTFPFFGYHPYLPKVKVGYSVVFGSSMATQLYFFLKLGVKYVFQIGTIGALQNNVKIYDIIIPTKCLKFDWISRQFHSPEFVSCDKHLLNVVEETLGELKFQNYHTGNTVSVATNWIETPQRVKKWNKLKMLGVEQETATIYSICKAFKAKPIALLRVMDAHRKGQELGKKSHNVKEEQKLKKIVRFYSTFYSKIRRVIYQFFFILSLLYYFYEAKGWFVFFYKRRGVLNDFHRVDEQIFF